MRKQVMPLKSAGLTLIEVVVTVAIIGILAAVAWPIFEDQLQKNQRREAVTALMRASQQMHQCRTDQGDYGTGADECDIDFSQSEEKRYNITANVISAGAGFVITADRIDTSDPACDKLTIDHLGRKGFNGTASTANTCWGE